MLEENQLEQVLLEKLGRQSVEESAISYRSWRAKTFEEVVVRNRQARQQQYSAQKKADKEEALRRDQEHPPLRDSQAFKISSRGFHLPMLFEFGEHIT
ncbi:unnamed protein product [Symbiodinium sp. CCMP2456]|nr:unnamed protein product [Symbiodinium sp. CCMP2456]